MIKSVGGCKPLPLQLPIGQADLKGVVDLVKMKGVVGRTKTLGAKFEYVDIPEDLKDKAKEYRQNLVETAVEEDEKLMESYLEEKEPSEEDLIKCVRKGTLNLILYQS